jgi:hypothetical protein
MRILARHRGDKFIKIIDERIEPNIQNSVSAQKLVLFFLHLYMHVYLFVYLPQ